MYAPLGVNQGVLVGVVEAAAPNEVRDEARFSGAAGAGKHDKQSVDLDHARVNWGELLPTFQQQGIKTMLESDEASVLVWAALQLDLSVSLGPVIAR